ncbi:MAG: hypothetical protein MJ180_00010 [Candidatus Gastranaerophilales bacterium]|nr:hypothetical protein [Candidatus Gastranaerophilales bacterium]
MIKKFLNWLNKPRCLEVSYILNCEEPTKDEIENVVLTHDFNARLREIRTKNFDETKEIIKSYTQNKYQKDGLLITNRQLEEETNEMIIKLLQSGAIDNMNRLNTETIQTLEKYAKGGKK